MLTRIATKNVDTAEIEFEKWTHKPRIAHSKQTNCIRVNRKPKPECKLFEIEEKRIIPSKPGEIGQYSQDGSYHGTVIDMIKETPGIETRKRRV